MDPDIQQPLTPGVPPPISPQFSPSRGWIKWVAVIIFAAAISSAGTYFFLQSQNQTPLPTEVSTKAGSSPSPTPDPTATWKVYTNTKYGYSIKYPPDWSIIRSDDEYSYFDASCPTPTPQKMFIPLSPRGVCPGFSIHPLVRERELGPEESAYVSAYDKKTQEIFSKSEKMSLNGSLAYYYKPVCNLCDTAEVDIPFDNGNKIITIGFNSFIPETVLFTSLNPAITEDIFRKIISTFKFLDQNQTGIVSASRFLFRQFDPKQVSDYPSEVLALPDQKLVKMRCTEVYGRIGDVTGDILSRDTLSWITKKEMESLFETLDKKARADGKYLTVIRLCETEDEKRIVSYGAGDTYIGELTLDGNVSVKTTVRPTSGPNYTCDFPLALTRENILYYMCGSADGVSSSSDFLKIDLTNGTYKSLLHCSSTIDETGNPKRICQ